jgi:hypothetical protein
MRAVTLASLLALGWCAPAAAYEADQLTDRATPPDDSLAVANAEMDRELGLAVTATNEKLQCRASERRTKRVLAREIDVITGRPEYIWSRGFWRAMGHNTYERFLETSPDIARREFPGYDDIFRKVTPDESIVLHEAGIASTIHWGDHLLGTDKAAHFQVEGYDMWRASDDGKRVSKAIRWSTGTENGLLGLQSSQAFSFGDLAANYAGMQFYQGLLSEGSVFHRDEKGCVVQVKPWDWNAWVTDDWDEVKNPSVFAPKVARAVAAYLVADRDDVCAEYAIWGDDAYRRGLAVRLARQPVYASRRAPKRTDPFELDALCASQPRPGTTAFTPFP